MTRNLDCNRTPNPRRSTLKNPLDSLWGTVISGFVLTAVLWVIARAIVSHAIGAGA